jgi:hypothetical protein
VTVIAIHPNQAVAGRSNHAQEYGLSLLGVTMSVSAEVYERV